MTGLLPLLLVLAASLGLGILLGVFGAGGSIFAVPVLVYGAGLEPVDAVGTSLAIVGATSLVAAELHRRRGLSRLGVALPFGGAGVVTAFVAGRLAHLVPGNALMLSFAVLMGLAALVLAFGKERRPREGAVEGVGRASPPALAVGAGVGAITGLFGVGGGFLAVPALVSLCRLPVREAVGTSLVVIAMNAAAGLAGHVASGGLTVDLRLVTAGTLLAVVGALAGERAGRALSPAMLRRGLAVMVLGVGVAVFASSSLG